MLSALFNKSLLGLEECHVWEPAWLNNTSLGSDCEDAILFTPDYSNPQQTVGYSRSSVNMFNVRS